MLKLLTTLNLNQWKQVFVFLKSVPQAINLIGKLKMTKYLVVLAVISLALWIGMWIGIRSFTAWLFDEEMFKWQWMVDLTSEGFVNGFAAVIDFIAGWGGSLVLFFYAIKLHPAILMGISFPIYEKIAEKTYNYLTGSTAEMPFNLARTLSVLYRITIPNLLKDIGWSIVYFFLTFVPVIGPYFFFRGYVKTSFYVGWGVVEPYTEIYKYSIQESRDFHKTYQGITTSTGVLTSLLVTIPFLGALVSPMICIIASGITIHELGVSKGE